MLIAAIRPGMSALPLSDLWPTDIAVSADKRQLSILFDSGERHQLSAEYLRVASPSAEVQGHSAAERKTVPGKRAVTIRDVAPIGNYAIRIVFSDGHDSGLYTWSYLAQLGREREARWAAYLAELSAKGLSREP
jgi:DUF971 family protein